MPCSNDYDFDSIQKRPLKLKSDSGKVSKKKKKKKHKKDKKKMEQVFLDRTEETERATPPPSSVSTSSLTPAQRKFKEVQEKREMDRIIARASTNHRDRVEEFNRNLDKLSEHYDIPKVSWTK